MAKNFFKPKWVILFLSLLATFVTLTSLFFYHPSRRLPAVEGVTVSNAAAAAKICPANFARNLKFGMTGSDVKELQKYLNSHGFILAKTGVGAPGRETTLFSRLTRQALTKFQKAKNILAAYGVFDEPTRAYLGCLPKPPASEPANNPNSASNTVSYTVGGRITGLAGMVVLQNNNKDNLVIKPSDSSLFVFSTALADGQAYAVTIKVKPPDHTCYVRNGTGVVSGANINNVEIACGANLSHNPFTFTPAGGSTIITYTLTYTAGTGGSLSGSASQTVNSGASGSAITAVADAHYSFVNWSDGSTANPRTDTNITANKAVTANFAAETFTITVYSTAGGTVDPPDGLVKDYGSSQTYTITPDAGYHINDVTVDTVSVGAVAEYTFTNIQDNHVLSVIFVSDGPQN
jgi:peptidoglycan hydrolase-like protein with peptidoglycan-binding domain